jgi:AAHS family 4-hydroxybenzoate transporter-like MFS transporter
MPTIFASANIGYAKSVIATSIFQGGGALGSIVCGWLLDRRRGILRLSAISLVAAPIVIGLGHAAGFAPILMLLACGAGFCIIGCQTGLNALSGFLYPTTLRSTGAGWANGIGRIGAISGPLLGAFLLGLHLSLPIIFLVAAIPSLCVSALALVINLSRPRSG